MRRLALLAAAGLMAATPVFAQNAEEPVRTAPEVASARTLGLQTPEGVEVALDCGGLLPDPELAFCVTAPAERMAALASSYVKDLKTQGWLDADGDESRIVFVRRRPGGGCHGLVLQALPGAADGKAYLALVPTPGDACRSPSIGGAPQ
ncbi:MAG: hypothetical protein ACT6RD_03940 [Brevundimonas sp.]|uniref:hypothetical protein n=1 Tax=Brevundimonas sp. TaxID=1871086 RepID=UPI004033D4AA